MKHVPQSLAAMLIAAVLASIPILFDGKLNDWMGSFLMILIFTIAAWILMILPILSWINRTFLDHSARKKLLPLFSIIYACWAAAIAFSFMIGEPTVIFQLRPIFILITVIVGAVWGIAYMVLSSRQKKDKGSFL